MFRDKIQNARSAYTYDDFLLVPNASWVEAKDVDTSVNLTKDIKLNIPIMSAAMDTVTESDLAIAIAREGGVGVIHRNITQEAQVEEVRKVKNAEDITVRDVITISPDSSVATVQELMENESVSGLPVMDGDEIIGIISKRDVRPYLKNGSKTLVKDENKKLVGILTIKDILNQDQHPNAALGKDGKYLVAAACGPFDLDRAMALDQAGADIISIDCAHAHNMNVVKFAETIKENIDADLCMGNIATREAAEDLIAHGADGLKVGIGPGSICTTRIVAGIGVPQLTAIADVADVANDAGIPVIADGGLRYSGDIAKAIGAGADVVMLGSLLAGTYESPGDLVTMNGRKYKQYRGMGSMGAMTGGSGGGADRYFQELEKGNSGQMKHSKLVPEGVEGVVQYKGRVSEVVFQLVGGLKASMGYCGAPDIPTMKKVARFVKISSSGIKESHPHDLLITNESPNYPTLD